MFQKKKKKELHDSNVRYFLSEGILRSHRFDFKRRRKTRLSRILFVFGVEMDDTTTPHWVTGRLLARTSASTWKWRKGPETVLYQSVRLISNEPPGILS